MVSSNQVFSSTANRIIPTLRHATIYAKKRNISPVFLPTPPHEQILVCSLEKVKQLPVLHLGGPGEEVHQGKVAKGKGQEDAPASPLAS